MEAQGVGRYFPLVFFFFFLSISPRGRDKTSRWLVGGGWREESYCGCLRDGSVMVKVGQQYSNRVLELFVCAGGGFWFVFVFV